jgi:hypothetical protein
VAGSAAGGGGASVGEISPASRSGTCGTISATPGSRFEK